MSAKTPVKTHILSHLPPRMHPWVSDIAETVDTLAVIAKRHDFSVAYFDQEARVLRGMLAIETGSLWRLSLMRLYYGIDSCWCGTEAP